MFDIVKPAKSHSMRLPENVIIVGISKEEQSLLFCNKLAIYGLVEQLQRFGSEIFKNDSFSRALGISLNDGLVKYRSFTNINISRGFIADIQSVGIFSKNRWGLPVVFKKVFKNSPSRPRIGSIFPLLDSRLYVNTANIWTLHTVSHVGTFIGPYNQALGSTIQIDRCNEEQESKSGNERVCNFKSIAKERRPELGSLLASIFTLWLGFWCGTIAHERWGTENRILDYMLTGLCFLLGFIGTIGLLLGFDLWSLWRLL